MILHVSKWNLLFVIFYLLYQWKLYLGCLCGFVCFPFINLSQKGFIRKELTACSENQTHCLNEYLERKWFKNDLNSLALHKLLTLKETQINTLVDRRVASDQSVMARESLVEDVNWLHYKLKWYCSKYGGLINTIRSAEEGRWPVHRAASYVALRKWSEENMTGAVCWQSEVIRKEQRKVACQFWCGKKWSKNVVLLVFWHK